MQSISLSSLSIRELLNSSLQLVTNYIWLLSNHDNGQNMKAGRRYIIWFPRVFYTFLLLQKLLHVINAAVNGHLEFTLLKGRQRFDAVSTSNLEVYKFRDWWMFTYFIFGRGESSPNNIWSMVNRERTCVLLFYYFLYFKVNLGLEKINQLGESSPNFIFAVVNLDPLILEMRWIDGESWPNDFDERWTEVKTYG